MDGRGQYFAGPFEAGYRVMSGTKQHAPDLASEKEDVIRLQLAASAFSARRIFEIDSKRLAAVHKAAEFRDGSPGFVAFHADKAKASAFTAEDIGHDFNGVYFAELRE